MKIDDSNVIDNAKFQYLSCSVSAAYESIITKIAKGNTLREAESITEQEVIKKSDGLPDDEC